MKRSAPRVGDEMAGDSSSRFERLPPGHRVPLPDPRRAAPERLADEIRAVSRSPIITAVLEATDAVLLVLNAERQIVGF
ncbi:MAG TPA: hypothetical protein VD838_08025, partial [Anaeromyxobacteraceae bacterium]|nr:hypothetical protein [Anaeromyxobacteraceae bacterium]